MTVRFSTGLKEQLLDTGSLKAAMDGGFIHIFAFGTSNTIPGPDAEIDIDGGSPPYVHLATISESGGTDSSGLDFAAAAASGVLAKGAGTWSNVTTQHLDTDTAAFFVHVAAAEFTIGTELAASTTAMRIVGSVGTAGADINLQSVAFVEDEDVTLDFYNVTLGV